MKAKDEEGLQFDSKADAIETAQSFVNSLEDAPRQGSETDTPEGSRYILVSDTLAKELVGVLGAVKELLGFVDEHDQLPPELGCNRCGYCSPDHKIGDTCGCPYTLHGVNLQCSGRITYE